MSARDSCSGYSRTTRNKLCADARNKQQFRGSWMQSTRWNI